MNRLSSVSKKSGAVHLELVETKIAELRKRMSTENDEPLFDIGGES